MHCHNYPFKFNRVWLREQEFIDIVHSSWTTQIIPQLDPMDTLTFKLQRLKGKVKDWEKEMKQSKTLEAKEVDLAIQLLLTFHTSSILLENEATHLSQLKAQKESLLSHEILT